MACKLTIAFLRDSHSYIYCRFLWVYCQLDYLGKCLPERIEHALDELPATLDGTYERTLREINDTTWEFAQRLFLCVAAASRPLRVEELAELLAFDFKAGPIPKFRKDWRLENPLNAVLSACSTLLALVNNCDDDFPDSPLIHFSHFSVKEFMTSSRFAGKRDTVSHRYHVSMSPAHTHLAQACLGILLHLDEKVTRDNLQKSSLVGYAAEHWVGHARFEGVSQSALQGMRQLFDPGQPYLARWVWICDPIQPWRRYETERPSPLRGTPLHYAAFCGFHTVVKFLVVEHPQDVQSRGVDGDSTPLHLASQAGHVEVARTLVDYGADVTARDEHGSTPLHRTSGSGSVEVARLLIEQGADVTDQNKDGSTPLHQVSASTSGSVDLARFLIEHGADTTAQNDHGSTPLHQVSASQTGGVDLAQLLVEHGGDVTAQDERGSTPLHQVSASRWGNVDLARRSIPHRARRRRNSRRQARVDSVA